MNKLPLAKRVQILSMLVEGSSMRSISRVADVSINTIAKLLAEAGEACATHHDKAVVGVKSKRVQCDEIWSFCYAKKRNVETAKAAPAEAGDIWTWTALDADSKLIVSFFVGGRDADSAHSFMQDVAGRLATRVQLTTDAHKAYLDAIEGAFGGDIDYAKLGCVPIATEGLILPWRARIMADLFWLSDMQWAAIAAAAEFRRQASAIDESSAAYIARGACAGAHSQTSTDRAPRWVSPLEGPLRRPRRMRRWLAMIDSTIAAAKRGQQNGDQAARAAAPPPRSTRRAINSAGSTR